MDTENLLIIMSDEHDPRYIGASGNEVVQTPALNRLAARGTRFTNAYTPSPICVPARASFATGRYIHELPYWDNAMGYDGKIRSWTHRLQNAGNRIDAIGKLHYRRKDDPLGFDNQLDTMHLQDGIGQVWGSIRDPLPEGPTHRMFQKIGAGVSSYNIYDRNTANKACNWLKDRSEETGRTNPWTLYVGFAAPHFPLVVPRQYIDRYPSTCIPPRKLLPRNGYLQHPWIKAQERYMSEEVKFADEDERILAIRAYYGLCSFLDEQVGIVLDALEDCGLSDNTRVIYTSDHGENLGTRGLWGKSNLYEESTKIPMIIAGSNVPQGHICSTPVSLVDCYPSVLHAAGLPFLKEEYDLPGKSLFELAHQPDNLDRAVVSEYHAVGAVAGAFMIRKGRYKYHYYVGMPPELFDLENDPEETVDLAGDSRNKDILDKMEQALRSFLDPEAVDAKAKAAQAELIEKFGGREKAISIGPANASPVPGKGDT